MPLTITGAGMRRIIPGFIVMAMLATLARAETLYSGMEARVEKAKALDADSLKRVQVAAANGDAEAKTLLAYAYLVESAGLKRDIPAAARLFREAAEKDDVVGELMIASML